MAVGGSLRGPGSLRGLLRPRSVLGPRRPPRQRGEHRIPAVLSVVVAIVLYALLPDRLLYGSRYVVVAVEVLLLTPLVAVNPTRLTRETSWSRIVSLLLVTVITIANMVALVLLLHSMLTSNVTASRSLLVSALQIWLTNIITFGLAYWELDRGGPVARTQLARDQLPAADFRFPQDEDHMAVQEVQAGSSRRADWMPTLIDYLYVSVTNSTAFSPTDTMPLSSRAKLLMAVQGMAALVTSLLVVGRAVNILQ